MSLLLWLVVAAGVGFRLVDFVGNRPLWRDEAALALNILDRPFEQLIQPLENRQAAPPFFLWAEKCASLTFGPGEHALRLLPLIAGLLSIPLFAVVAATYLGRWQTLLATLLFAIGERTIRYSTEVKQYSSDVFFTLAIYWCLNHFIQKQTVRSSLLLAAVGACAVWTSYPALFILGGAGIGLLFMQLKLRRNWSLTLLPILSWTAAIAALVQIQLLSMAPDRQLLEYYGKDAFPPARASDFLPWLVTAGGEYTMRCLGLGHVPSTVWFGAALIGLGGFWLARKNPLNVWFLAAPAVLVFVAAGAHLYPLIGRLLLFLAPAGLISIACAFKPVRNPVWWLANACMAIVLLWQPVAMRVEGITHPRLKEDSRTAFEYAVRHWQAGDKLYVYYGAEATFHYYRKLSNWKETNIVIGSNHRKNRSLYATELSKLRGKRRLWVLMSHEYWKIQKNQSERDCIIEALNRLGTLKDAQAYVDADVLLYDLTLTDP